MALPFVSSSALRSIRLDPRIQTKNLVHRTLAILTRLADAASRFVVRRRP